MTAAVAQATDEQAGSEPGALAGADRLQEREVSLAVPAHDLAPSLASYDPDDFPVPSGREESWRFTPMRRLKGLHDGSATRSGASDLGLSAQCSGDVTATLVSREDSGVRSLFTPTDRVAAAAYDATAQALLVNVPAGALQAVAHVRVEASDASPTQVGLVVIEVGAGAQATVALEHVGTAGAVATNVVAHVGPGAALNLVSNHLWDPGLAHVGHQHAVLEGDSQLRSVVVTLGGDLVRHAATVDYRGRGGSAELIGVYFTDAGQHHEHRLFVDHSVPDCRSDVIYKGALQGQDAHAVWIGDVLIRAAATATRTYELNRNLVLTKGARADSVPNLEIETGQIEGAGHASATGRFDDEQLFYLMSRGVPESVARRLVVRGFFLDALARIGDPELSARITAAVDAKLGAADPRFDLTEVAAVADHTDAATDGRQ